MMKIKNVLLLFVISVLLLGCNREKIYYQDNVAFDSSIWPRFQHLTFDIPIDNPKISYDVIMMINHNNDVVFNTLPIQVNSETQSGERRFSEFHLKVKDKSGNFVGEKQENGTFTFSHTIRHGISAPESSTYHIDIECFYPKYNIEGINNVTIQLVKTKDIKSQEKK